MRFRTGVLLFLRSRVRMWREYFFSGEWELRELPRYVRRDAYAVDVGANIGDYSFHLGRLSRGVIAFEPNPDYAEPLLRLRLPGFRLEQVALSDVAGSAQLRIPRSSAGEMPGLASLESTAVSNSQPFRAIEVPVKRLDDFGLTDVGFIKIDVEGHEERVLAGALRTLETSRPVLLIEIEHRHNPGGFDRVVQFLAQLSYTGYFFDKGVRRPLAAFNRDIHQVVTPELDRGLRARRDLYYVNNFLFLPTR